MSGGNSNGSAKASRVLLQGRRIRVAALGKLGAIVGLRSIRSESTAHGPRRVGQFLTIN